MILGPQLFYWFTNLTLLFGKYIEKLNFNVLGKHYGSHRSQWRVDRQQDRHTNGRTDKQAKGHHSNIFFLETLEDDFFNALHI